MENLLFANILCATTFCTFLKTTVLFLCPFNDVVFLFARLPFTYFGLLCCIKEELVVATHFSKCTITWGQIVVFVSVGMLSPDWAIMLLQVAARTETGVRRRTQAMSRSCSKRKSRFSSLWGLDTTSKKKSKAHPSINQVCEILQLFSSFKAINRTALAHMEKAKRNL